MEKTSSSPTNDPLANAQAWLRQWGLIVVLVIAWFILGILLIVARSKHASIDAALFRSFCPSKLAYVALAPLPAGHALTAADFAPSGRLRPELYLYLPQPTQLVGAALRRPIAVNEAILIDNLVTHPKS